ncbi:chitobiase/beta-hexosaminidase C-terminal domain-containing protein, partial [Candidatus Gracilibacteria bacterium]|nr:chitobiase/beta-hexosaminidase C-terminal domain-containing protein [Candidatus Gracilibacteria bacterium]
MHNLDIRVKLPSIFFKILFVCFFLYVPTVHSASWDTVSGDRFSTSSVSYQSIATHPISGQPYVVYTDTLYHITVVKRFDGTSWVQVGEDISPLEGRYVQIAFHPTTYEPYVAYADYETRGVAMAGRITVKRFNGSNWIIVDDTGVGGFTGTAENISFVFNPYTNIPYIAYEDYGASQKTTVVKYDGGSATGWSYVGTRGFSTTIYVTDSMSLSFDSTTYEPYVAYGEYDSNITALKPVVKKFDGSTWNTVGTERFTPSQVTDISVAVDPVNNVPYVAYKDGSVNNKATVQKFNGTTWEVVGIEGFSKDSAFGAKILFHPTTNEPYVVYQGALMKFNGTTWDTVGSSWVVSNFSSYEGSFAFGSTTDSVYIFFDTVYIKRLTDAPAAPVILPYDGNFYTSSHNVTLSTYSTGTSMYYTLDGSTPGATSTLYTGAISISASTTVKAISIKSGFPDSDVMSQFYEKKIGGEWTQVGEVVDQYSGFVTIHPITHETYVLYGAGYNIVIKKYSTTTLSWELVDELIAPENVSPFSDTSRLVIDPTNGDMYVSYSTNAAAYYDIRLRVLKFNGSTWDLIDPGSFPTWGFIHDMQFSPVDGALYIAGGESRTVSTSAGDIFVKKLAGSTWVDIKDNLPTLSGKIGGRTTMSFDPDTNELYIGQIGEFSPRKMSVYKLSGSTWEGVGAPEFTPNVYTSGYNKFRIAFDSSTNEPYAAYSTNDQVQFVDRFDGSSWVNVGVLPTGIGVLKDFMINPATNNPTIILSGFLSPYYSNVLEYNGTSWVNLGASNFSVSASNYGNAFAFNASTSQIFVSSNGSVFVSPLITSAPVASPTNGTFTSDQSVTLTSATEGATIYYTVDGSTPTVTSTEYSGAILLTTPTTIKAFAVKDGIGDSGVMSEFYLFKAATTTASVSGGTFNTDQSVTLTSSTPGSTIYYTTDGSTPTSGSALYSSAITIATSSTLKAIAVRSGYANSDVMSEAYVLQVATPTSSIAGGEYAGTQSITISSVTPSSIIYYTVDGSTPTSGSTLYSSAVAISATTTLKAIAIKSGYTDSGVMSEAYVIVLPQVANISASVAGGTFSSDQSITLTSTTTGTTIYYTIDGSTPTSTQYSSAILLSSATTLKAIGIKSEYTNSLILSETYTFVTANPAPSVSGGTFNSNQSVTLTSSTPGSSIYYTTDGSTPTSGSTLYSSAISIATSSTLKAIAIKSGYTDSGVVSETYNFVAAIPVASPSGLNSSSTQSVTLSSATPSSIIYYTTDGSTPTSGSTLYSSAITIATSSTLKAIAIKSGYTDSAIMSESYTIYPQVEVPIASPSGSSSSSTLSVTLSSATLSSVIYYTTDGSTPTTSSTQYSVAISVSSSQTLKAIAVKTGYTNSSVMSEDYTIASQVIAPVASVTSGTFYNNQSVTLSSATPSSTIYYTTDGSTPTSGSTLYSSAITISASTTLKAIAVRPAYTNSSVITESYVLQVATPTPSVIGGTFSENQTVSISSLTSGSNIYYTTDGSTPTSGSTLYSGAVLISSTTTLKAIAIKSGYEDSSVMSESYVISSNIATLTANTYTVTASGTSNETINSVPYNTSKAVFLSALVSGQSGQTWNSTAVQDPVVSGDVIVVTSQDGSTQVTYTINVLALTSNQVVPDINGIVDVSTTTSQAVITDITKEVSVVVGTTTNNPTVNISSFMANGTGTLPGITVTSLNAYSTVINIATSTVVSSASTTWNGVVNAPATTTVTLPTESGQTKTLSMAVEVGIPGERLVFNKAVRMLLPNQANKRAGYVSTSTFVEITSVCSLDTQASADTLPVEGECKMDVDSDLVIWTKHFTTFATYTQTVNPVAVISSTSGGSYFVYSPVSNSTNINTNTSIALATVPNTNTNQVAPQNANSQSISTIKTSNILELESEGEDITALQVFLYKNGFYPEGEITGYFGPLTERAVRRFQAQYASEVLIGFSGPTGMVGNATRKKINEIINSNGVSQTVYTNTVSNTPSSITSVINQLSSSQTNITPRDISEDVRALQQFLNAKGFTVSQSGPGSVGQ